MLLTGCLLHCAYINTCTCVWGAGRRAGRRLQPLEYAAISCRPIVGGSYHPSYPPKVKLSSNLGSHVYGSH